MGLQDELWKDVIEELFPQFLSFFAPDLAQEVDWERGYEFLDKELHQIAPESEERTRYVDRLIKVFLKEGGERWVLVHVEVQGYLDRKLGRRMFTIFYRLLDKYEKDIVSLAVFSDAHKRYKPDRFTWGFYGCSLEYKYRAYNWSLDKMSHIRLPMHLHKSKKLNVCPFIMWQLHGLFEGFCTVQERTKPRQKSLQRHSRKVTNIEVQRLSHHTAAPPSGKFVQTPSIPIHLEILFFL